VLLSRFDLPCYAPQTMAFLVRRDDVAELRRALDGLFVRGEGRALAALWDRLRTSLEHERRTRRWRFPRATLERLCVDALALCAGHPEAIAKLTQAVARNHDVAPHGSHLIVPARRWRDLEIRFGPMRFIPESWSTFFADALDSLFTLPEEDPTRPLVDLSYVATAARENEHDVRCVIDGETIVTSRWQFSEQVRTHTAFTELLEAMVGPFESSRGPGPFLPMPGAARPIIDPRTILPVFDYPPEAHVLDDRPSLSAALDEVRAARAPVKPWDDDAELFEWSPTAPPWNAPWSTLAPRWEPYRDRFIDLLNAALETERAVLFASAEVGDLGPGGSVPVDESWGSLVA
jgi:hypothetical protein